MANLVLKSPTGENEMDAQRRIKLLPRLKKGSFQRIVSGNKPIVPGKMAKIRIVRPERVKPMETAKVDEPKEPPKDEPPKDEPPKDEPPKVVDEPSMPIPAPMSETEERMADLLEVAQEAKEIADKAAEIERAEGKSAEAPSLPMDVPHDEPRKKKRGRKGRRGR